MRAVGLPIPNAKLSSSKVNLQAADLSHLHDHRDPLTKTTSWLQSNYRTQKVKIGTTLNPWYWKRCFFRCEIFYIFW
jgi:hypothetical protein